MTSAEWVATSAPNERTLPGSLNMEIIWITAGAILLLTFGLAFVRARECRRLEVLGQTLEMQ